MKARHEGTTFSYAIAHYTLLVAARSSGSLGHKGWAPYSSRRRKTTGIPRLCLYRRCRNEQMSTLIALKDLHRMGFLTSLSDTVCLRRPKGK